MLKSLTVFCIVCLLLLGFGATSLLAKGQPTTRTTGIEAALPINSSAIAELFPGIQSAPVVPSVITSGEIAIREQQIQILNDLESTFKMKLKAGIGSQEDLLALKYFRLTNQIQLLQAKQLVRPK